MKITKNTIFIPVLVKHKEPFELPPLGKTVIAYRSRKWKGLPAGFYTHVRATKIQPLAVRAMVQSQTKFWLKKVEHLQPPSQDNLKQK